MQIPYSSSIQELWQRDLKPVNSPTDQLQIHQTLHILLEEEDSEWYQDMLDSMTSFWRKKKQLLLIASETTTGMSTRQVCVSA